MPRQIQARHIAIMLGVFMTMIAGARAEEAPDCLVSAYRLADGSIVDIAPSEEQGLRWLRLDGTTGDLHPADAGRWRSTAGWTGRPDGKTVSFSDCKRGRIDFAGRHGQRLAFDVSETRFESHGVTLEGRLVMPKGKAKAPIVILVHGAEFIPALQNNFLQRLLPAQGIGAFVYDKRGTGKSAGSYSQDFQLLGDDAIAAMREARRLAGPRAGRVGYQGGSQAGWVIPIAVNKAPVDFAIVSFGLAVSVIEEDQQQAEKEMRDKGYPDTVIAKALEVARAAETVIASGFKEGFVELDAVRARYGNEPWYKDVHGNFAYMVLPHSEEKLHAMAADFNWGTPFHYDPMPSLRANRTPQLWVLGGEDYEAPSAETSRRIKSLIADDLPFTLALYPGAEHGMTLFEKAPNGARISTRYPDGYFRMIRDFAANGRIAGAYGDAQIARPRETGPVPRRMRPAS